MSVLKGKHILLVGEKTPQTIKLAAALQEEDAHVFAGGFETAKEDNIIKSAIDLVLVNADAHWEATETLLAQLRDSRRTKELPVFVIVATTGNQIKDILMLGAADYVTKDETVDAVMLKLRAMFGQPDNYINSEFIDISPTKSDVAGGGTKVYTLEDDPLLQKLIKKRLDAAGFSCEFAKDSADVVSKIETFLPHVIILDIMLPTRNGFDVLREIKTKDSLKNLPVIIFSNRNEQEDRDTAFALGAERFYVKALTDLSLLVEAVEELTSR